MNISQTHIIVAVTIIAFSGISFVGIANADIAQDYVKGATYNTGQQIQFNCPGGEHTISYYENREWHSDLVTSSTTDPLPFTPTISGLHLYRCEIPDTSHDDSFFKIVAGPISENTNSQDTTGDSIGNSISDTVSDTTGDTISNSIGDTITTNNDNGYKKFQSTSDAINAIQVNNIGGGFGTNAESPNDLRFSVTVNYNENYNAENTETIITFPDHVESYTLTSDDKTRNDGIYNKLFYLSSSNVAENQVIVGTVTSTHDGTVVSTPDSTVDSTVTVTGDILSTYKIGNISAGSAKLVGNVTAGDDTIPITIVFDLNAIDSNTNQDTGAKVTLTYDGETVSDTLTLANDKVTGTTNTLKKDVDISSFDLTADSAISVDIVVLAINDEDNIVESARFGSVSAASVNVLASAVADNQVCGYESLPPINYGELSVDETKSVNWTPTTGTNLQPTKVSFGVGDWKLPNGDTAVDKSKTSINGTAGKAEPIVFDGVTADAVFVFATLLEFVDTTAQHASIGKELTQTTTVTPECSE